MLITFVFKINLSSAVKNYCQSIYKGVLRSWVRILMKQIQEMYLFPDCYEFKKDNFEVVAKNKVYEIVCASLWYTTTNSVWRNFIGKRKGWKNAILTTLQEIC